MRAYILKLKYLFADNIGKLDFHGEDFTIQHLEMMFTDRDFQQVVLNNYYKGASVLEAYTNLLDEFIN